MENYMDKVYCFNFPFKINTKNYLLSDLLKKIKILDSKKPYIISTAHDQIDLTFIKTHKKVNKLKRTGLDVYLYEVLSTYLYDSQKNIKVKNRGYYSEHNYTVKNNKSLFCTEFDQLDNLARSLNIKINVYCCDYNVDIFFRKKYKNLNLYCYDIFLQSSYKNINIPKAQINYKFWCANRRYTPARHATMCYLADKKGKYSWQFNANSIEGIKFSNLYNLKIENGNKILNKHNFYLDYKVPKQKVKNQSSVYIPKIVDVTFDNLYKTLKNCFLAVITETRFGQPTANFSEKTLHPIHCNTPFVLVAPPFTLEYLHKLGFKTFNQWWPEDYDKEVDHIKRLEKIFDIINYIDSMTLDELADMYAEMTDIFSHNLQVVDHLRKNQPKILR